MSRKFSVFIGMGVLLLFIFYFGKNYSQKDKAVEFVPAKEETPESAIIKLPAPKLEVKQVETNTAPIPKPNIKDPMFKAALKDYLEKIPEEIRSRAAIELHEYNGSNAWVHLTLDGVRVEMTEAHLVKNETDKVYAIRSGGLTNFPKVKVVYKNLSNEQIVKAVQESNALNTDSFDIIGSPKKLWSYKPGLTAVPVVDVKLKTASSTHSGEILRIDTSTSRVIKKYQSVRH